MSDLTSTSASTSLAEDIQENANVPKSGMDFAVVPFDPVAITIKVGNQNIVYGGFDSAKLNYTVAEGQLDEGHYITMRYALDMDESDLTDSGHAKVGSYTDVIAATAMIIDQDGVDVTELYDIAYDFGDLTVTQRVLSVTIQNLGMTYGDELPSIAPEDQTHYSFDSNALASGDTLSITIGYDIRESSLSDSGNLMAGLHPGMVIEESHNLSNAENYIYAVNPGNLVVHAREITVGFNAADKIYDGTTEASRDGDLVIDGVLEGDIVRAFDTNVTYAFSDKNVGEGKTVTATGDVIVVGKDADNYVFTFNDTALADITPLPITIGFTANDKTYDGTTAASRDMLFMDEILDGDDIAFDDTGIEYTFDNKNVGRDKTVTAEGFDAATMLSGADLGNYDITFVDTANADIVPIAITIGFMAKDKLYDGNTTAERDVLIMDEVLEGDDIVFDDSGLVYTFDNKNVGDHKTVTAEGFDAATKLSGADLGNYDITFIDTAIADITPLEIAIGFTANDKLYDGNTTAERDTLIMDEILDGDDIVFDDSGIEYTFDNKNVGRDKTVTATGFDAATMLSGVDLGNYDITFVDTANADIVPIAINIGFTANDKTYDGMTTATRDALIMDNVLEGDDVVFDDSGIEYNFEDASVGTNKTVTATGFDAATMLSGADLSNYDITFIDTTTADITPVADELISITIKVRDQSIVYGDLDNVTFKYDIANGELKDGHSISITYAMTFNASDLTDSGHLKVGSYTDVIGISQIRIFDQDGKNVTALYDIAYDFGDLTVTQRVLSVTIRDLGMTYGDELPSFAPEDQTHYTFDPNALASGDTLSITIGYNISDSELSSSGNLAAGVYANTVIEESHNLSNAENYIYGVNNGKFIVNARDAYIGFNAADKVYDGTTEASRVGDFVIDGVLEGDIVRAFDPEVTYAFSDKNVGEGKTVTATGNVLVVGKDAPNYNFTFDDTAQADITPLDITIGFTAHYKTYDGTTDAMRYTLIMDEVLDGDDIVFDDSGIEYTFENKNVGNGKTVTATGFDAATMLSGADLGNYDITFNNIAEAGIVPISLEIGFTANDKAYDGTTAATRDELIMDQMLEGDDVVFDDTGIEYNFDDASVGNDKTVTATGFDAATMLSGADLGNYEIIFVDTTLAAITEIPVPENLVGTKENLTWSEVTGASGYVVQFSQDDFATVITIKTDTNGIEQYNMSADTWQWRVRANEGSLWAVGNDITIDSNNTSPVVVMAEDDDVLDALFVQPIGIWNNAFRAEHAGILNGWEGTSEHALLKGKNKIADIYQGGAEDANVLLLTDDANGDALFVDDIYSDLPGTIEEQQARVARINEIRAGAGDDIIDLTSQRFDYVGGGMTVQGGLGNDVIWANKGNNTLFGDAGNDRIVGAGGNDVIVGGSGDDSMHGGGGEDIFAFGGEWGNDSVEQLADGKVTLWFDEGSLDNWDVSTLTYRDGDKSVVVNGVAAENITLKFGDDGSEQYGKLLAADAFDEFSSERIFENKNTRGTLA